MRLRIIVSMWSKSHNPGFPLFLLGLILGFCSPSVRAITDDAIRIDVPAAAKVRIENRFGQVAAEVWREKYVSVSANIESGGAAFKRSPIVIEKKAQLLLISVVRRPTDPEAQISLTIKLPEGAHAEIFTSIGSITMRGSPGSATLKSEAGDIRAELGYPVNADINAQTAGGSIRSELAAPLTAGGRLLQTRLGTGSYLLRINTVRGDITLSTASALSTESTSASELPRLSNTEASTKGAGTPATHSESEEIDEGDVIRVDSQLATLNLSIIDRNTSRGIVGLGQSDFRLFEDGVEQQILQFESSSAPFDLMLLIDVSGSTRDKVKLIRAAALRFIEAARPSDRIGIISFSGKPNVVAPVTLDRRVLRERVNEIDTGPGDTKAYDALYFSVSELLKSTRNTRRAAIVMMSDGLDGSIPGVLGDGSKLSYPELLAHIREFDGVVYTLWLNTEYEAMNPLDTQPEAFDMGHDRMKETAEAGGGVFYRVERLEDLAGAYERVVADLGTVYSLAYRPSNNVRDGKWRSVRVTLSIPSAVARGKHGYYAN